MSGDRPMRLGVVAKISAMVNLGNAELKPGKYSDSTLWANAMNPGEERCRGPGGSVPYSATTKEAG